MTLATACSAPNSDELTKAITTHDVFRLDFPDRHSWGRAGSLPSGEQGRTRGGGQDHCLRECSDDNRGGERLPLSREQGRRRRESTGVATWGHPPDKKGSAHAVKRYRLELNYLTN